MYGTMEDGLETPFTAPNQPPKQSRKVPCRLIFAIAAAVVGSSFQFGFNTGVINSPGPVIQVFINETFSERYGLLTSLALNSLWAFTVAVFAVGGMIGGLLIDFWSNRFGRRNGMLMNNVFAVVGGGLMGISQPARSVECLIVGRFIIGIQCGLSTGLCPLYVSEVAPKELRGSLGVVNQLGVTATLLLSQILGLPDVLGNDRLWGVLLAVPVLFAVVQLASLPFCPESPRFLLLDRNDAVGAEEALNVLRTTTDHSAEIGEMRAEQQSQPLVRTKLIHFVQKRSLLQPLAIAVVLQLSQQLSGINAVFYYSTDILKAAGLGLKDASYVTLGVGVIMVLMTLVSVPLMERSGRRLLHLIGLGGMAVQATLLAIMLHLKDEHQWASYVSVAAMLVFVVFFAIGPGSIPWLIVAELFSQSSRSTAVSVATTVNWAANVVVGQGYPPLANLIGNYSFVIFAILLVGFWTFTYFFVPETKNKTFDEIARLFRKKTGEDSSPEMREKTAIISNGSEATIRTTL